MLKEELTRNRRLIKAYQVASHFINFPNSRADQEKLIRLYYNKLKLGKDNTVPIEHLSDNQIRSSSERLFQNAHNLYDLKTNREKTIIRNLFLLEKALQHDRDKVEALDERVCIQLEQEPDDSDLVQEYNAVKGYQ